MNQTKFHESRRTLQDVVFILDEVEDLPCSIRDVEKVCLNPFFEDYFLAMDSCRLILNQQLYSSNSYELSQWCLLFPMEYIFEDFLAGFFETHFSDKWKVHYQKSDKYLAIDAEGRKVFNMQHDIYLQNSKRTIIIDTKYKPRYIKDAKKGISQSDLYQVTSYAFRRGCTEVFLVYPNFSEELRSPDKFTIPTGFAGEEKINVTALEIPFWSFRDFDSLKDNLISVLNKHILLV